MRSKRVDRPRILLAAGGTGGHIYPAIAIADEVRKMKPEAAITFAGTRERLEWQAIPQAGYEIAAITAAGLQRDFSVRNLATPFKAARGLGQSIGLIRAFDPDVVVGTGGYVTGPVLAAAFAMQRRTLIQEQNAHPGITNRLLGKRADEIHVAFEEARHYFAPDRCFLSGNPTRAELANADSVEARRFFDLPQETRVLFAFGGSLGSQALNEFLLRHWMEIAVGETKILWQTGKRYYERVKVAVEDRQSVRLLEYVDRMDLAYAAADLVLSRAGAITCSELLLTGTPAVLVPSPNVAEDHQTKNATSLSRAGAAIVIREDEIEATLVSAICKLIGDGETLARMSQDARAASKPDAARTIAEAVLRLATRSISGDGER